MDTLKLQEKFGFGYEFFGIGDMRDLEKLEQLLLDGERISAVVCEFPSNPLLYSVDLASLREMANHFNFLIIIDDTIGGFINVDVLKFSDIMVSSLTKTFSGAGNVMAGSLIINPASIYLEDLNDNLEKSFQDAFWCEDAAVLELNSRDYEERILYTNISTEKIVDSIIDHPKGIVNMINGLIVKTVLYTKYNSRDTYVKFARNKDAVGYGSLFSIIFHSEADAISFYDNVELPKGPSLGTNFSLICPYTLLAHFNELDHVSKYGNLLQHTYILGVDRNLIRFSIGLEDSEYVLKNIKNALNCI